MAVVQVPTALYWAVAGVIVIGAISTYVKIRANRWLKEKKKRTRAKDRVDVEEMVRSERAKRKTSAQQNKTH